MYLQKVSNKQKFKMTKIAGSGSGCESGSISQRHGSADPDPHQNVMDPQHCFFVFHFYLFKDASTVLCLILFCTLLNKLHITFIPNSLFSLLNAQEL